MNTQPTSCRYELFVDGSPGPKKGQGWAGWGVALMAGDSPVYESCGALEDRITTDAIELEALIQGLSYLLRAHLPAVITVWTDSRYVATAVAQLPLLAKRQFTDGKGHEVGNAGRLEFLHDLLYEIGLSEFCVIRWTQGHAGTPGNELADKLSKLAAYKGETFHRENRVAYKM